MQTQSTTAHETTLACPGLPLCLAGCQPPQPQPQEPPAPPTIEVFFSPKGGCTETVVKELGQRQVHRSSPSLLVTSARIAKALVEAHKRGVDVR